MKTPRFIDIDGKLFLWRELVEEKTRFAILRTLRKSASFETTTYRLALKLWSRHSRISLRSQHADLIDLKSLACMDFLFVSSPHIGNHTFRATGITAYLKNGGSLEMAQHIAGHEFTAHH